MRNQHSAAEKIKEISGTNPLKCMKCGKCSATCPSFNEMDIKPHQFVSYVVNEDIEASSRTVIMHPLPCDVLLSGQNQSQLNR